MTASLLLLILAATPDPAAPPPPDTVVVCPPAFQATLRPWIDFRTGQGHQIIVISNLQPMEGIRQEIRRQAQGGRLKYVVLVGDADPALTVDPMVWTRSIPTYRAATEVLKLYDAVPHIGTDNWYADLNDDQIPDVAVGRLSADTPKQLASIVQKTLAYEQSPDFGLWRRQVNVVAGVGGFNALTDSLIESATRHFLSRELPADYQLTMTYANWRSPYCPDPREFNRSTLERLHEGCLFWVYLGHGYHVCLDQIWVPGGHYPILANSDIPQIACRHGAPIALFLSCYAGAFDANQQCLAEEMLRTPGAPVAVIAGSRVTMPYGMSVLGTELLDECFRRHTTTLGEALLHAKQRMMQPAGKPTEGRAMLDTLAGFLSPTSNKLAVERAEHVMLFNLLGDPMLRLRYPQPVTIELSGKAYAGRPLGVHVLSGIDGQAIVELVVRRDRLSFAPPTRAEYPKTADRLAEFQTTYRQANDGRLATAAAACVDGECAAQLQIPPDASGPCHVRVFVEGRNDFAQGAVDVNLGELILPLSPPKEPMRAARPTTVR